MTLQKEADLTGTQREDINDLLSACRRSGDTGVSYPLDEENGYHYLLRAGDDTATPGGLLGVLGIFPLSDESAECIAYVRPEMRRQGLFSQVMLPEASDDFADLEFIFPVRPDDSETIAVMDSIGAVYDRTEYMMELTLEPAPDDAVPLASSFTYLYPPDAGSEDLAVSHCRVEKVSDDSVCLTDVETVPEMRGLGYGESLILSLKEQLASCGIRHILLHVSGKNAGAVSLYEKTGFRTTETLSYYIF